MATKPTRAEIEADLRGLTPTQQRQYLDNLERMFPPEAKEPASLWQRFKDATGVGQGTEVDEKRERELRLLERKAEARGAVTGGNIAIPVIAGFATGGASLPAQAAIQASVAAAGSVAEDQSQGKEADYGKAAKSGGIGAGGTYAGAGLAKLLKYLAPRIYGRGLAKPAFDAVDEAGNPVTRTSMGKAALEEDLGVTEQSMRKRITDITKSGEDASAQLQQEAANTAEQIRKLEQLNNPPPIPPNPTLENLSNKEWAKYGGARAQRAYLEARGKIPRAQDANLEDLVEEMQAHRNLARDAEEGSKVFRERMAPIRPAVPGSFFSDPNARALATILGFQTGGPWGAGIGFLAANPLNARFAGYTSDKLAKLLTQYPQLAALPAEQLSIVLNGLERQEGE